MKNESIPRQLIPDEQKRLGAPAMTTPRDQPPRGNPEAIRAAQNQRGHDLEAGDKHGLPERTLVCQVCGKKGSPGTMASLECPGEYHVDG